MKLKGTNDPRSCRATEEEVVVMMEDAEGVKEFAKELKKESGLLRRRWERDYYNDIRERYASAEIASAMLKVAWEWTRKDEDDD